VWRRKGGRKAEWVVVLAGIEKTGLSTVALLKTSAAIGLLLQRMMRGNAAWDAKLHAAMKAFAK